MKREQNDKARILKDIIVWLDRGSHLRHIEEDRDTVVGTRRVRINSFDEIAAQFVPLRLYGDERDRPPIPGLIVKCLTNPRHDWGVSRYVSNEGDHYVLSEIGNPKRLLNMFNERLDVLVGVPWHVTAEGWQRRVYEWAIKALAPRWNKQADDFKVRFRGAHMVDGCLVIKWGPHIWIDSVHRDRKVYRYAHRSITLQVTPKTRLKDIVAALQAEDFAREWSDDELVFDAKSTEAIFGKESA